MKGGITSMSERFKYVSPHIYVMANMTLSVPDELLKKMKKLEEIKWSAIARHAFEEKINDFEEMEKIASKSKANKADAKEIARKVDEAVAKKLKSIK